MARQVGGNGANVVHVHRHRVVHLGPQVESRRRGRGPQQHVEALVGPVERLHHQRAHPLRLGVVRVVVTGRQRIRPEHDAPLDLGAEPGRAGGGVHGGHVVAVHSQPVAHAVVAGQVRRRLGGRNEVVGREAVAELGYRDLLHLGAGPGQGVGRLLHPGHHIGRATATRSRQRPTRTPSAPSCTWARAGSGMEVNEVLSSGSCPATTSKSNAASSTEIGKGPDLVQRAGEGDESVARDPAIGRLHPHDTTERRRLADRPSGVGAQAERCEARRHGGGRAAAAAAGHLARVPRVARRSERRVLRRAPHGELVHVRLAQRHRAGGDATWSRPWRRTAAANLRECARRTWWRCPGCTSCPSMPPARRPADPDRARPPPPRRPRRPGPRPRRSTRGGTR